MRNLLYIALSFIGATSADAAMQLPSAAQEKPAVVAATQRSASDLLQIGSIAALAQTACQLQQQPASNLCSAEDAIVVASAPPRRPPRRTRRR